MQTNTAFPAPGADALNHSLRLREHIGRRIAEAGGWIDFARYMDLVLYAPGLGYYSAGARKFGPAGDFVTAPEISPLFSRCLARAVAQGLEAGGTVMELGAGSGTMAADMLQALNELDALPERYLILEVSADLRERQRQTLRNRHPDLCHRLVWLDRPPENLHGVVVANEVLDALPVHRFRRTAQDLLELGVAATGQGLHWATGPASAPVVEAVATIEGELGEPLPMAYTSEVCTDLGAWLAGLAGALERGLILLVDYGLPRHGYYHRDRSSGTLRCHYRHRAHDDPFLYPGLQDITAWVDFTAVATAATAADLTVTGFTTQAQFLLNSGMAMDLAGFLELSTADRLETAGAIGRLVLPGEMGERFKVMSLARGLNGEKVTLPGRDLRHLL